MLEKIFRLQFLILALLTVNETREVKVNLINLDIDIINSNNIQINMLNQLDVFSNIIKELSSATFFSNYHSFRQDGFFQTGSSSSGCIGLNCRCCCLTPAEAKGNKWIAQTKQ
jgi:hypothetical protein